MNFDLLNYPLVQNEVVFLLRQVAMNSDGKDCPLKRGIWLLENIHDGS